MKRIVLSAFIAIFSIVSFAHAEVSKEKRAEIERLLQLTGTKKLMDQMMTQMISAMKQQMKGAPESFWQKFQQRMDTHELVEKIIPIYDKYYTLEDLKAINAFYQSPPGQKMLSSLPQVMKESMQVGQEWGEKIGREAAEEAEKESKPK